MTTDLPRCGEVVGFDSDAHTITLRVETMPDGLAIGDRLHGPRHVLTTERLGEALVCHGVIDEAAVADPNGYDGGKTLGALALAARDLAEHGPRLAPEHVEELRACAEWHGDAEQKWTDQFADFIAECARAGVCNDAWLAHHIGQLVQRVEELEARVARLEGKRHV